jgi:hypothetical protein
VLEGPGAGLSGSSAGSVDKPMGRPGRTSRPRAGSRGRDAGLASVGWDR